MNKKLKTLFILSFTSIILGCTNRNYSHNFRNTSNNDIFIHFKYYNKYSQPINKKEYDSMISLSAKNGGAYGYSKVKQKIKYVYYTAYKINDSTIFWSKLERVTKGKHNPIVTYIK